MDAKKCDICGTFYLPYNTQFDAVDMSDANRIYFVNEDSQTYHRFDTCPCCMNKFLDLFYDIKKRYEESDTLCTTSKEELLKNTVSETSYTTSKEKLLKNTVSETCSTCLHRDSLPDEDLCKSCEDFSNFTFKGCV